MLIGIRSPLKPQVSLRSGAAILFSCSFTTCSIPVSFHVSCCHIIRLCVYAYWVQTLFGSRLDSSNRQSKILASPFVIRPSTSRYSSLCFIFGGADVDLRSHVKLRYGANMCLWSVAILCDIVCFAFGPAYRGLPRFTRSQRIVHGLGKAGVALALFWFAVARVWICPSIIRFINRFTHMGTSGHVSIRTAIEISTYVPIRTPCSMTDILIWHAMFASDDFVLCDMP